MQVIIPMSGSGSRFQRHGYTDPKPLIVVDGKPMIEHVVEMFPGETDFLFICARTHLESTPLASVLRRIAPYGSIVAIEPHKLGPVYATMAAKDHIRDDDSVIVNYCDFSVGWDYEDFCKTMRDRRCAGAMTAYRGFHPHSLGPNLYAYMREERNYLLEIQEKHCFTNNRMFEYASSGTYYMRSGRLLKHYFIAAMEKGLSTNGEFYASMPYNLLVEDGLDVFIYELKQFLQWGTPEDMQEYQKWSDYFHGSTHWKPAQRTRGTILMPAAGDGVRFRDAGYHAPKPLIPIGGKPMLERALRTLPAAERLLVVGRSEHEAPFRSILDRIGLEADITRLEQRTEGQACTCLTAEPLADPGAPILVATCDASLVYDEARFAQITADPTIDAAVFTFRNHPDANRKPEQYGWLAVDGEQLVQKVSCKRPLAGAVETHHGIIGSFWFRSASTLFSAIRELIERNIRIGNEFYLDSAIELLVAQGCRVKAFEVLHNICFGTPDAVRTFEYWHEYFGGKEVPHVPVQMPALDRAALLQRGCGAAGVAAELSRSLGRSAGGAATG